MIRGTEEKHALDKLLCSSNALHALACVWVLKTVKNKVCFSSGCLFDLQLGCKESPLAC